MYPAKDARMSSASFQAFYPQWEAFAAHVDPAFSSSFWRRVAPARARMKRSDRGRDLGDRRGGGAALGRARRLALPRGRSPEKVSAVAEDARVRGASAVHTGVADLDDIARHGPLVDDAERALGGLDAALVAHGTLTDQAAAERDFTIVERDVHTNFLSAASILTIVANHFESEARGNNRRDLVGGRRSRPPVELRLRRREGRADDVSVGATRPPRPTRRQGGHGQARLRRHTDDRSSREEPRSSRSPTRSAVAFTAGSSAGKTWSTSRSSGPS